MEPNTRRKEIGRCLQQLRKAAGFKSAKAFANAVKINPGTYTSYEQGERSLSYETAWDIADALNCSLDDIGGRKWATGKNRELTADERGLVESFRRMDPLDRDKLRGVADTFVVASEKDGAGSAGYVEQFGIKKLNQR